MTYRETVFYYLTHGDAEYVVYRLSDLLRLRIALKEKDEDTMIVAYRVSTDGVALLTDPAPLT